MSSQDRDTRNIGTVLQRLGTLCPDNSDVHHVVLEWMSLHPDAAASPEFLALVSVAHELDRVQRVWDLVSTAVMESVGCTMDGDE